MIKSHHNVGGLPEEMNLKLVEPLRELFRTKCARSASNSACPTTWSTATRSRAGSGRAYPRRGEEEYADLLRRADDIFISELRNADWYHKVSRPS